MKPISTLATVALLANAVFEFGAGTLILVSPASVFPGAGPQAAAIGRTLACAAISAGGLGLMLLFAKEDGRAFRAAFAAIGLFHVVLAVGHGASILQGYTVVAAPIFHGALAVLFGVAWLTCGTAR
jgi:hypothetical protein